MSMTLEGRSGPSNRAPIAAHLAIEELLNSTRPWLTPSMSNRQDPIRGLVDLTYQRKPPSTSRPKCCSPRSQHASKLSVAASGLIIVKLLVSFVTFPARPGDLDVDRLSFIFAFYSHRGYDN